MSISVCLMQISFTFILSYFNEKKSKKEEYNMDSKTTETKYGMVLKGKDGDSGLTKLDLAELLEKLSGDQVYPIEIEAKNFECSAMGFIDKWAASELDFDYQDSGLRDFISLILETNQTKNVYQFKGIDIWFEK